MRSSCTWSFPRRRSAPERSSRSMATAPSSSFSRARRASIFSIPGFASSGGAFKSPSLRTYSGACLTAWQIPSMTGPRSWPKNGSTSTGTRLTPVPATTPTSSSKPASRRSTGSTRSCAGRNSPSSPAQVSPITSSRRRSPARRRCSARGRTSPSYSRRWGSRLRRRITLSSNSTSPAPSTARSSSLTLLMTRRSNAWRLRGWR